MILRRRKTKVSREIRKKVEERVPEPPGRQFSKVSKFLMGVNCVLFCFQLQSLQVPQIPWGVTLIETDQERRWHLCPLVSYGVLMHPAFLRPTSRQHGSGHMGGDQTKEWDVIRVYGKDSPENTRVDINKIYSEKPGFWQTH